MTFWWPLHWSIEQWLIKYLEFCVGHDYGDVVVRVVAAVVHVVAVVVVVYVVVYVDFVPRPSVVVVVVLVDRIRMRLAWNRTEGNHLNSCLLSARSNLLKTHTTFKVKHIRQETKDLLSNSCHRNLRRVHWLVDWVEFIVQSAWHRPVRAIRGQYNIYVMTNLPETLAWW